MKRRYRCNQCGDTFLAEQPACERCGIDPREHPRFGQVIVPIETIHFDPPTKVRHVGRNVLACQTDRPVAGSRATGEPAVVNCEACRETEAWQQAAAAAGLPEFALGHDEVIEPPAT